MQKRIDVPYGYASMLLHCEKSEATESYNKNRNLLKYHVTFILAVTAPKASNLNSAVWDRIIIFCCINRHQNNLSPIRLELVLNKLTKSSTALKSVSREWHLRE